MSIDLDQYRDLFVEEAREHLRALDEGLTALGNNAPIDADALFRAAHSLKGMAATVGLEGIAHLAHAVEDRLDALRGGAQIDTPSLRVALDTLQDAVDAVAAKRDPVGLDAATQTLRDAPAASARSEAPLAPARSDHAPPLPRSVRIPAERVDRLLDRTVALQIEEQRLARLVAQALGTRPSFALTQAITRIQRAARELHSDTMELRALPVDLATAGLERRARDVARRNGKEVHLRVSGGETRIERSLLEALRDPLQHLVTNAVVHGIEPPDARRAQGKPSTGTIDVRVAREKSGLLVTVHDDGAGIDPDRVRRRAVEKGLLSPQEAERADEQGLLALLKRPGFSTQSDVSEDAGRGVGLDVVAAATARVGGTLRIASTLGAGTTITLGLPPTMELIEVIDCDVDGESYAFPAEAVRRLVSLPPDVATVGQAIIRDGDEARTVKAVPLASILSLPPRSAAYASEEDDAAPIVLLAGRLKTQDHEPASSRAPSAPVQKETVPTGVLIGDGSEELCVIVDSVSSARQAVVKPLDIPGGPPVPLTGATLRADGRVAPLVDPLSLLAAARTA